MSHVTHMNESCHTQRRQSIARHKAPHHIYTFKPFFFPSPPAPLGGDIIHRYNSLNRHNSSMNYVMNYESMNYVMNCVIH